MPASGSMRGVDALAVAVALLLAATACPARTAAAVPAPGPAGLLADTAAIAVPSAMDGSPTPAEIAALRERVGRHPARVRLGEDVYDIRGAWFDSRGVTFDRGGLRVLPRGPYYEPRRPPPSSPIGWDRIDRITVRKPCGLRGAIAGSVVGTAAMIGVFILVAESNDEMGPGAFVLLALPPVGASLGGGVGALVSRSEPGWQRSGAVRAASVGTTVPAPVPPSLPLGVLRDDIGRHPIRLGVGQDRYEIRDARLDPAGITFDPAEVRRLPSRAPAPAGAEDARWSPVSSPIGWDRIDRIEARVPSAVRGATWGMLLLPVALLALTTAEGEGLTDFGALGGAVAIGAPIGALVGAGVGALVRHSRLEWERTTSASPSSR